MAVAAPIPEPAPVTITTFPSNLFIVFAPVSFGEDVHPDDVSHKTSPPSQTTIYVVVCDVNPSSNYMTTIVVV